MKVTVSSDDFLFACALALDKQIDDIVQISFVFENTQKRPRLVFVVDLKGPERLRINLENDKEMCHAEWVYHFLNERGLWGWQNETRN